MNGNRTLDTSYIVEIIRAPTSGKSVLASAYGASASAVAWGELMIGENLVNQSKRERERERIKLIEQAVEILPVTKATAAEFGKIFAQLRRIGKRIPSNDLWIAATAIEHGLPLQTRDEDFKLVAGRGARCRHLGTARSRR